MRAILFDKQLKYLTDYPIQEPGRGEALIRVTHAGICSTDLEIVKGYMGFKGIPGHEFVGIVERCADNELLKKRVVGEINIGCGKCGYCKNSLENHCPDRSVLGILNKDGVFAEYVTLPISNLYIVPDSVSDEEALFVEPLAAAFEITRQIDIRPSDKIAVIGDGKLGLLTAQVLSLRGPRPVVFGKHKDKLSLLDQMGIETRPVSAIKDMEFDLVVDATGSPSGIETALRMVKPRGTIVVKTTVYDSRQLDMNKVVIDEITILGSRCGPFYPAIKALESGAIDVRSLITATLPLNDGIEAIKYASKTGVLKVIMKM